MPPFKQRPNSFSHGSDCVSSSELSPDDGDTFGATNSHATRFLASPRHHDRRVHVSRSAHCEFASSNVKNISAGLPGFSDWRTDGSEREDHHNGGASDSGRDKSSSGVGPKRTSAKRTPAQRRKSSLTSDLSSNINDIENDVLTQPRCSSKQTPSFSRHRRRPSVGESLPSVPSLPSVATEQTDQISNTTQATMNKYKKVYEAMLLLKEAEAGLVDVHNTSIAMEHNTTMAKKSSFYNSGSSNRSCINDDTTLRRNDHHDVISTLDSFYSIKIDGRSSEMKPREDKSKVPTQNKSNTNILVDEMIDGLQVQELILGGTDTPSSSNVRARYECDESPSLLTNGASVAIDNRTRRDTPIKSSNERDIVPRIKKNRDESKKNRDESKKNRDESKRNLDESKRNLDESKKKRVNKSEGRHHHSRTLHDTPKRRSNNSGRYPKMPSDKKHHYSQSLRARSPTIDKHKSSRNRDHSQSSAGASIELSDGEISNMSNKSSRSNRSNRSTRSTRSNQSISNRNPRSDSSRQRKPSYYGDNAQDDGSEGQSKVTTTSDETSGTRQRKGLYRKMKRLAGKVKDTLGELGSGVHKYQLGERARYRVVKVPRCLELYDPETKTVEVEIVALHIDAVLEMPYYTIKLPAGKCKQTNWDNLIPLAEYKKRIAPTHNPYNVPHDEDLHHCSSSRSGSSSRHKGREPSGIRQHSRVRSSCQGDEGDSSTKSTSSHKSLRSRVSQKLSRSISSRQSHSKGRGTRSPSPFSHEENDHRRYSSNKRHSSRSKSTKERSPSPFAYSSSNPPNPDARRRPRRHYQQS